MTQRRMRPAARLAATALLLALAGCGSLIPGGQREAPRVFAPDVQVRVDPSWPTVDWQLSVATPSASESLTTSRIAVRPQPGELEVYAGALWMDAAPELVQNALVRAFEDSQRIMAVSRFGGGLRGDFALLLDLRRFESIYVDGHPQATIELSAKLTHFRGNRVVAARTFHHAEPATGTAVPLVSEAFGRGLSTVVSDVVGWTLTEGERVAAALEAAETPATRSEPLPLPRRD
ncbi:ABC-type transport auxiliary lipoprotein family protein [Coralloluteibacterium thermophilus]|uniref:ABC-type transport auxiliary lipoprotein family protein n=1 Tax=Coralloluteibacterium thermophilum TaxID=2707049 RepID=A0ABV9NHR5_9GAMM